MNLLHIGFSNSISINKVIAILNSETQTSKRIREESKKNNMLIDCTKGRKLRSMVLTDSTYVFLSCISPEVLLQRFESKSKLSHEV